MQRHRLRGVVKAILGVLFGSINTKVRPFMMNNHYLTYDKAHCRNRFDSVIIRAVTVSKGSG